MPGSRGAGYATLAYMAGSILYSMMGETSLPDPLPQRTSYRRLEEEEPMPAGVPASTAHSCGNMATDLEIQRALGVRGGVFRSQSREDVDLLKSFFAGVCGGSYIEMGALDGVKYSNTAAFHTALDWKGVLIEPSPDQFIRLERNRQNELATVNAAVCEAEQDIHFCGVQKRPAVHGIYEFATPEFRRKWWPNQRLEDCTPIKCQRMDDILRDAVGDEFFFDFWSLDVEGAEYSVLETVDFTRYHFGVVLIETGKETGTPAVERLQQLMDSKGYYTIGSHNRSTWFVNKQLDSFYQEGWEHAPKGLPSGWQHAAGIDYKS